MRPLVCLLAALAATAAPAAAGTVLYVTAATPGKIQAFCAARNGALQQAPFFEIDTLGGFPSRIRYSPATRTLYVAENDRVEMYRVEANGRLSRPAPDHVPVPVTKGINSRDIVLDCPDEANSCACPDGACDPPTTLYVPERREGRIVTFALDPVTGLRASDEPTSCVADSGVKYEFLVRNGAVSPPLLYASQTFGDGGAVVAYALAPPVDGMGERLVGQCLRDDPTNGDDPDDCNDGEDPANHPEDTDGRCKDDPETSADDDGDAPVPCTGLAACRLRPRCAEDAPEATCPAGQTPCGDDAGGPCRCCCADESVQCQGGFLPCPDDAGGPCFCCAPANSASSERRNLPGAGDMVLAANPDGVVSDCNPSPSTQRLYVQARFSKQILGFNLLGPGNANQLDAGNFDVSRDKKTCEAKPTKNGSGCNPLTGAGDCVRRQKAATETDAGIRHQNLVVARDLTDPTGRRITILASQFADGRVDGYRLSGDDEPKRKPWKLPGQPTYTTRNDVRTSPVGLLVRDVEVQADDPATPENEQQLKQVMYVAAGVLDRVQVFKLDARGLPDKDPFNETAPIAGSFPNDLVLAEVAGACD